MERERQSVGEEERERGKLEESIRHWTGAGPLEAREISNHTCKSVQQSVVRRVSGCSGRCNRRKHGFVSEKSESSATLKIPRPTPLSVDRAHSR